MNKHAQNLRAVLTILPAAALRAVHRNTILAAANEIDRLDAIVTKPKIVGCTRIDGGADCNFNECEQCSSAIMERKS